MSQEVRRPKADTKKIHCKNEFELCYLRHQYIRKAKTNPTKDEMEPYRPITERMAKDTYYTYQKIFLMIGFDLEDLVAIANIHLISFLGLFSLDRLPQKYDEFINLYRDKNLPDPTAEQVMNKNKANCTLFLKQRMEDVVRVCRQKARNIKGLPTEKYFYYCGSKRPPEILRDLVDNYERLGYRKLDQAVYKSIRKKVEAGDIDENPVFKLGNLYYIAIPVEKKNLYLHDFSGAGIDPYDSIHNMTPEEIIFKMEDAGVFERRKKMFSSKTKEQKCVAIREFIQKNSKNPLYVEEIRTARRILKNLS